MADRWKWEEHHKTDISKERHKAYKRFWEADEGRFKEFNWVKNKLKVLNKTYYSCFQLINLIVYNIYQCENWDGPDLSRDRKIEVETKKRIIFCKNNVPRLTTYLKSIYNKDLIKERMPPKDLKGTPIYDIWNQFHPKFINKLPMRAQIFIRNKIKEMIEYLEGDFIEKLKEVEFSNKIIN